MKDALTAIWTRRSPQSAKADDRQVPNSAGGFTFTPGRTGRLHRFLTLGTDGGTAGFTSAERGGAADISPLDISPRQRLDDAIGKVSNLPFGRTDCALPLVWALRQNMEIDHFCVYTGNETWAGTIHPHQALAKYRQRTGIPARLSVVGMTATDFTIADPEDPGSLDVAGFDSAVPSLLSGFALGDI